MESAAPGTIGLVLIGPVIGAWTALLRRAVGFEQVATDDRLVDRTPRADTASLSACGSARSSVRFQFFGICLELLQ